MCTRQRSDDHPRTAEVGISRRRLLAAVPLLGLGGLVVASCGGPGPNIAAGGISRRIALVYRGPASCEGCSESVGSILTQRPFSFHVVYCGPKEATAITAAHLDSASLYVQPGGGNDLKLSWSQMRPYATDIRRWVHGGGHYLGICLGGYLAGFDPGFGLLPGDSGEYITSPGATVHDIDDTTVTVDWRGTSRQLYFQDGPYFSLRPHAATVLATYSNGLTAAAVARCGSGSVGVVGPHPEADDSWYAAVGLPTPRDSTIDLARELIATTLSA
jgi:glutamine amidotransferase-like uncharacterized protein